MVLNSIKTNDSGTIVTVFPSFPHISLCQWHLEKGWKHYQGSSSDDIDVSRLHDFQLQQIQIWRLVLGNEGTWQSSIMNRFVLKSYLPWFLLFCVFVCICLACFTSSSRCLSAARLSSRASSNSRNSSSSEINRTSNPFLTCPPSMVDFIYSSVYQLFEFTFQSKQSFWYHEPSPSSMKKLT